MDKEILYRGPIVCDTLKDFLNKSFTVITEDESLTTLRLPIIPFIESLQSIKKRLDNKVINIKNISINIPQFDIAELSKEDMPDDINPFSNNYKPIRVFAGSVFAIYIPLIDITVLFKITSNSINTVNFVQVYYNGFILKDIIYHPNFDTKIYFYRLSGSDRGEPLLIYKESRYKMIDISTGTEYKFKSGTPLVNLADNIKTFYYTSVLQDLIEEIIDLYDITFLNNKYDPIRYKK